MKPLSYGYLRVTNDEEDGEICRMERDLQIFAEDEGLCLATIFYEYNSGSRAAFAELTEELSRADAHHVIVPSLAHLSSHQMLRDSMLTHLELHASAQVLVVKSADQCRHDRPLRPARLAQATPRPRMASSGRTYRL